jgi:hypothetical protein
LVFGVILLFLTYGVGTLVIWLWGITDTAATKPADFASL